VKTLKEEESTRSAAESLLAEARLLGSLEHPNIVPMHCLAYDEKGLPLLVMKRVEGVSLAALLKDAAHPAWSRIMSAGGDRLATLLSILGNVCAALHFAHSRGIIHRDVKPDNIMVGAYGEVYLMDWGIATRLAVDASPERQRGVVGTPGFMAP